MLLQYACDTVQTMEASLKELALKRLISREQACQAANNPKLFDDVVEPGQRRPGRR